MVSATPREFLPLPAGGIYNHASMGKIQSSDGGRCYSDGIFTDHGYTEFKMVRIATASVSQASAKALLSTSFNFIPGMGEYLTSW